MNIVRDRDPAASGALDKDAAVPNRGGLRQRLGRGGFLRLHELTIGMEEAHSAAKLLMRLAAPGLASQYFDSAAVELQQNALVFEAISNGRASCRERVCQ